MTDLPTSSTLVLPEEEELPLLLPVELLRPMFVAADRLGEEAARAQILEDRILKGRAHALPRFTGGFAPGTFVKGAAIGRVPL